jgi:hypothetical protein
VMTGPAGVVVDGVADGVTVGVATAHLVQTVEVMVLKMVEVVIPVETLVTVPEVWVAVTGHTVVEVLTMTVTTVPDGAGTVAMVELETTPWLDELVLGALDELETATDEAGVVAWGVETTAVEDGPPGTTTDEDGTELTGQMVVETGITTVVKTVE